MKTNSYQRISLWFMGLVVLLWLFLQMTGSKDGFYNYLYSFLFGLTPLLAGMVALSKAKQWGGLKTAIGKAVFFVGLGVFCWGCGELIWSYYNFFMDVPAPYPSLADLGFAPSIFFYGLGAFYLSKVTGAKFGLRSNVAKFFVVLGSVLTFLLAYYLSVTLARGGVLVPEGDGPLKTILDIAYPLGDFLALAIAVIVSGLSFPYLGGKYKWDILAIFAGLAAMYVGDTMFSWATTVGTYYNGNWGDLWLASGTFLLSYGVLGFCKVKEGA
jgi:hypothetical protein